MKAAADITDGEKAGFAVTAGRCDHGRGPIEFVGKRERQASFPDVLGIFRRVELDLHYLIVYINKWTVNRSGRVFDHELLQGVSAPWFSILRAKGWPLCFTPSKMGKEPFIPLPARPF